MFYIFYNQLYKLYHGSWSVIWTGSIGEQYISKGSSRFRGFFRFYFRNFFYRNWRSLPLEKVFDFGKIHQLMSIEKCIYGIVLIQSKYKMVAYRNLLNLDLMFIGIIFIHLLKKIKWKSFSFSENNGIDRMSFIVMI